MRPSHERMAAFLRRADELGRLPLRLSLAAFGNHFERAGEREQVVQSLFASKFGLSCEREVSRMVDLYGWRAVADKVPIDLCRRLCALALAEEFKQMDEARRDEERSERMVALQPLAVGPLRGRRAHIAMLDDASSKP